MKPAQSQQLNNIRKKKEEIVDGGILQISEDGPSSNFMNPLTINNDQASYDQQKQKSGKNQQQMS